MDEKLPTTTIKPQPPMNQPLQAPEELRFSAVTSDRVLRHKQGRFNPIRGMKPERLTQQLEAFDVGTLDPLARTMESVANKDDTLKAVIGKRKAAVRRMSYEIMIDPAIDEDQKAEAEAHQAVLKEFYSRISVTNAIDRDQRGGFSMLVDQIMDAVLYKYAVHELLWKPSTDGLGCTFNFVPLYFFENRTGQMRFLQFDGAYDGSPLEENAWMVSCGPGLMIPSVIAWMYKNLSLKDWVFYNEKYGIPGILGKTAAAKDSTMWQAMEEAVAAVNAGLSGVANKDDEIQVIDFKGSGELPQPKLVERMDRFLTILWRGGDLSTIAKDSAAVGSNPQQEDTASIEDADAQFVSETLNERIDKIVIGYNFGCGTRPLAFLKVCPPKKKDIAQELLIDRFFLDNGLPLLADDVYERHGRTRPPQGTPESELVRKPEPEPAPGQGAARFGANERGLNRGDTQHMALIRNAVARAADAENQALEPLWERLDGIMELLEGTDAKAAQIALKKFLDDLPAIQAAIGRSPAGARAIEAIQSAGFFNGMTEAVVSRN